MQKPYLNFYTMPKVPPSKEFAKKPQEPPPAPPPSTWSFNYSASYMLIAILLIQMLMLSFREIMSVNNYFTLNLLLIKIVLLYFAKFHCRTERRKN